MEFDLENPLTNSLDHNSTDTASSLFLIESDYMPADKYLKTLKAGAGDVHISVRREAISSILQFSCKFDPFLSYLAVNYLDRFLSSEGMVQAEPWVLRLLAISCVTLAAKMTKTELGLTDCQGGGFIFERQKIERMEYLVLGALKWRMRSVTPFSFIPFFLSLLKLQDPAARQVLKARAAEILLKAQNDMKLLEFKPSIVAASALLFACHELLPSLFLSFKKSVSNCSYVNKEKMMECYRVMDEYETMWRVNVVERHFWISESDKSGSTATKSETDMKRRKTKRGP